MAREHDPLTTSTLATLERVGVPHEAPVARAVGVALASSRFRPGPLSVRRRVDVAIHEPGKRRADGTPRRRVARPRSGASGRPLCRGRL